MENFEEKNQEQFAEENVRINAEEAAETAESEPGEVNGRPVEENEAENAVSQGGVTDPSGINAFSRINYSEQKPVGDYSGYNRGLKVFCAALAAVILLVGACAGGYFLGRSGNKASFYRNDVKLDLAAKPKSGDGMTAAQIYEELNPSIVGIRVFNSTNAYDASGVIYTEDGYIITNDHIYASVGAPKFRIYAYDGKEYDAEYVAGDTVSDLAVLKIKDASGFKAPQFGDSNQLVCGESVFAVGRQSDASGGTSITSGTVSLTSRRVKSKTNYSSRLIQTDSATNPGSSGGALVNMYGQVVGITSSKLSGSEYDAISFAIPTVTVKRVVEQLISGGKVTDRAKLGITYSEINSVIKQRENRASTGLLIVSVSSDSDLFGKVSEGDIITHINGMEITKDDIVLDVIESLKAGDTVKITVLTSLGDETEINAKLGANIGESSFSNNESLANSAGDGNDDSSKQDGGTFDFPFGE